MFRPQLRSLEDRCVPSTLTVLNNLDSGAGSLRAEIAAANAGDTITFDPSLNGQTIKLTSDELTINKSLNIQGPGAGQLTISGGNTWRIFEVGGATTNVTLSGLTITQGHAAGQHSNFGGNGGAVVNANGSILTISGCTVSNSRAALDGGGIYNFYATLNIVDSTVTGNIATNGAGTGDGGGLYSLGGGSGVSMTGCTVSNNRAQRDGGGVWLAGATMTIHGCTLSGNSAGQHGGAIYHPSAQAEWLTITDSFFSHNTSFGRSLDPIAGPWTDGGGNTFA